MFINRKNDGRFIASFDAADMLRKVINNTENARLVFESTEDHSTNAVMLVEGDLEAVARSISDMRIPYLVG